MSPRQCGPGPARAAAALALAALAAMAPCAAPAKDALPLADDPALQARVMHIAEELRCLVCQNETIAASHADLAVDLRNQIRKQLTDGRSDDQIRDYMTQRYGDFVLYRPPLKAATVLLWAGPFALLLGGLFALLRQIRHRRADAAPRALSAAESERARRLLDQGGAP